MTDTPDATVTTDAGGDAPTDAGDAPDAGPAADTPNAGDEVATATPADAPTPDAEPADSQDAPSAIAGADPSAAAIPPEGVPVDTTAQGTDDVVEPHPEPVPSFGGGTALSLQDNVSDPENPQHIHRLDADNSTSGGRIDNVTADAEPETDAEPSAG